MSNINQILNTAYPDVLRFYRRGDGWRLPELNELARQDRIHSVGLAGVSIVVNGQSYPIQGTETVLEWSLEEDQLPTNQRVRLLANMLDDAILVHEDDILQAVGEHSHLYVCPSLNAYLSRLVTSPYEPTFRRSICTYFAVGPN